MNRALKPKDSKYFSVQLEENIWWLGAFEVDSEDFTVLNWVFHHTTIPEIINAQQSGEEIDVEGFGSYRAEWHMGGDLKTLKCMYNVSKGANAKSPCLYCMGPAKECNSTN